MEHPYSPDFEDDYVVAESSTESDVFEEWQNDNSKKSRYRQPHPIRPTLAEAVQLGTQCEAKLLYEGPRQCKCCTNWVDETPEWYVQSKEAKNLTRDFHGRSALLLRKRRGHPGEEPFVLESIDIQSPMIKKVLSNILASYPGINVNSKILTFSAPFQPLFHFWEDVLRAASDEPNTETRSHLKILVDGLQPIFEDHLSQLEECRKTQVVSFPMLWSIFKPGDLVYTQLFKEECVMRLKNSYMSYPEYFLSCEYLDWDGKDFHYIEHQIYLRCFDGTVPFKDLAAVPLSMHPERLVIRDRLSERGRKFEGLKGLHFKGYKGSALVSKADWMQESSHLKINDRVIIDAQSYSRSMNLEVPAPPPHSPPPPPAPPRSIPISRTVQGRSASHKYSRRSGRDGKAYQRPLRSLDQQFDSRILSEDEWILCNPHVRGFLLKDKQWAKLCVDGISDISWNEEAFSKLVLPNNDKELILAFAEGKAKSNFDDFVVGKGRGVILLLSGSPGTGKTMTAESVAETMRVPLYTLSAGELGTHLNSVESNLKNALEQCAKWNAVLLFDEADVFLEKRDMHDLDRNAMVSVFLRLLEYYDGLLVLTTNRINAFDPAFESRVDIAINYPELSSPSRRQIWTNFIERLPERERDISVSDLDTLADINLNGRQIKNAMKTAHILATKLQEPLRLGHADAVLKLRAHLLNA